MFKRLSKKQAKQERDEELGLDEETKQTLGMHDTDSDESDSDSDPESNLESDIASNFDDEDDEVEVEWSDGQHEISEEEYEEQELGTDSDEDFDDDPPITLKVALQDPIYPTINEPQISTCIVCPDKLLKNIKMVEVHLGSSVRLIFYSKSW